MTTRHHYSVSRQITALVTSTALTLQPMVAFANPIGGVVSAGQASISQSGTTLDINQQSNKAIIDWRGFDIAPNETTQFFQPSSSAIALNRVNSNSASNIQGTLTANGNIIIINQNGVLFGAGSHVDVNSLVATTADIGNDAFMNSTGKLNFSTPGNPNAAIVNNGVITAAEAGLVGFVAPNVVNNGIITAKLGKVHMASGDTFTLDMYGDGLMEVAVSDQVQSQLVANSGLIAADGGKVALTAAAGQNIVNSLITNSGVLRAQTVAQQDGKIFIYAEGSNAVPGNVAANKGQKSGTSTVANSGIIDASGYGSGQTGGNISVLGDNVAILNGSIIDASGDAGGGYIKIGGDFHGAGTTPTALNTYVDANALIMANANSSGNGGNVAVWADNNTWFLGNIMAEGGMNSGNGGFVETSGHGTLDAEGYVDLTAPKGDKGTYLLDPATIAIYGNVTPAFNATDSSISLSSALKLWLDASDTANVNLTYNSLGTTATGTSGQNTITVSANTSLVVGARIRLGGAGSVTAASTVGADTYTITNISGTTITLGSNLTSSYAGSSVFEGYVSQLTDKSGNSNNATQGTAANMPLWVTNYQNGNAAVSFTGAGGNQPGQFLAGTFAQSTAYSFLSTLETGVVTGAQHTYFSSAAGLTSGIRWALSTDSGEGAQDLGWAGTGANLNLGSTAHSANTAYQSSYIKTSSGWTVYDGSNQISTLADNSSPSGVFTYHLGAEQTGTAYTYNGHVNDMIVYNTALGSSAQNLIEQYQSAKWGIALTPPGTGATEAAKAMASDGYSVFSDAYLVRLSSSANIALSATGAVTLDLQGDNMSLASGKSLSITAGTSTAASNITFISPGTITTNNAGITLTPGSSGSIVLNSSSAVTLASNGGAISLAGPVSLSSGLTVNSGGGAVSFSSTVNGAQNLTVNSGAGTTTFTGAVGGTTPLSSLAATSTNAIDINASVTTSGTQTYTGPVVLGANDTFTTTNSAIDFISTVDDGTSNTHSLTLSAGSGLITFGGAVGTTKLASLAATSTNAIDLNGSVTTGGTQTYTGPVVLGANDTLTTTNSAVSFSSTVNGAQNLTVNSGTTGAMTFTGVVGGGTGLGALSVTAGGGINLNAVTASSISLDSSGGSGNITSNNSGIITATGGGTITANSGGDINFSNIGLTTTNAAVSITAAGNAYLNAINSGTGNLTVSATDVYLYGGGSPNPSNLAGYYNFNEGSGTSATDSSGNGNTGTITGATYSSTVPGALSGDPYSLSFNGSSNYVSGSNALSLSATPITVTGWVRLNGLTQNDRVFEIQDGSYGIQLVHDAGTNTWGTKDTQWQSGSNGLKFGNASANTWYQVAVVFNGSNSSTHFYINGVDQGAGTLTSGYIGTGNQANKVFFGVRSDLVGSTYLNGNLDDVRIYNTALSATAVSDLYSGVGTWQVGTTSITASHNINLDLTGETLNLSSGKNMTLSAANQISNASTGTLGGASANGSITLTANSLSLTATPTITTTGTVTIKPNTASTTIGVAGGAGTLGITSSLLNAITAGSIVLGNSADTAAMTVGAYTWAEPVTFNNGSGKIEFAGIQTLGTNSLTAVTSSGNIQIDQGDKIVSTASSGNSIVLASGGNFINNDSNDGSSALSPGSGTARYLVYSADPSLNTLSGLSDAGIHVFNKTYAGYAPGSVTQTGNLFLYSLAPTITVTANNASRLYGAADPSFTASYSGLVDGDTSSIFGGAPSFSTPGGDTSTSAAGSTYTITASNNTLANSIGYTFNSPVNGTLTINKAHLTVTANNASRLYGASDPSFTDTITGFANSETSAVVSGSASNTTPGGDTATSAAGNTYAITPTLGSLTASNYDFTTFNTGTLSINKAHLTVTANNASRLYGASDPSFTDTITGFANSETSAVVSGSASNTTPGGDTATSAAGNTYAITPTLGSLTASNYDFTTFNTGTLSINKAHLTVTANNASRLYGASDPSFTDTITGFANSETSAVVSGSASNTTPGGDTATSAAGSTYAITPTLGTLSASNYDFTTFTAGTLTVNKAHLTVTANDASRLYGAADPSFTDSFSGFVNGQNSSVVSGSASNTTPGTDTATSGAGSTYAITATLGSLTASNYDFTTFNTGTLTVNKAHLTVTANNASRLYGASDPSFTDTITGFANSETSAVVSGSATNTTPGGDTATSAAGSTYAITPTLGTLSASNYDFTTFNTGTLTINKAHLTVTANNASRLYGASDPSFTDTITGFANSETSAVVSGSASNTTPGGDTATSAAGSTYAITPTLGTLSASNYDFTTFNTGTLTVNKAHLTVTANNASRLYGASDPSFTDSFSGFVNGQNSSVVSGSASNTTPGTDTATSGAGSTYAITATLGSLTASNYDFTTFNTGTLTVNKAHLTVTANNASRLYGASDPSFTDTITGFANSETSAVVSGSATNTTPGGDTATSAAGNTYAITPTLGTLSASNYDFTTFNTGTLTINKAHLTVTPNDATRNTSQPNPAFTGVISGFVNSQDSSVLTAQPVYATAALSNSPVGLFDITASGASALNYDFSYLTGRLTITAAPVTSLPSTVFFAIGNVPAVANPPANFPATYYGRQPSDDSNHQEIQSGNFDSLSPKSSGIPANIPGQILVDPALQDTFSLPEQI